MSGDPTPSCVRPLWRVLETDFRDGSGFLNRWADWLREPRRDCRLHHVTLTEQPPTAQVLESLILASPALACLRPCAHELTRAWIGLLPGFHRFPLMGGRLLLTLCVDDGHRPLARRLRELDFEADDIRIDGSTLRDAAVDAVRALALRCRRGTRLSVETMGVEQDRAAWSGALVTSGFQITDHPDSPDLHAVFHPPWTPRRPSHAGEPVAAPGHCVVVGAGLAGASAAFSLASRGWRVTVLDRADAPAAGASGLPAGVIAPHVSADDRLLSQLTRSGVRATLQRADALLADGVEWQQSGVLERRAKDGRSLPADWQAPDSPGQDWSRVAEAGVLAQAGLGPDSPAHWHSMAGWVKPAALVRAMLAAPGIRWEGHQTVSALRLSRRDGSMGPAANAPWSVIGHQGQVIASADLVVVAAGYDSLDLLSGLGAAPLPLNPLRGQVAWGRMPPGPGGTALPPFPLNGRGSLIGHIEIDGLPSWIAGATFERGCALALVRPEDTETNRAKLQQLLPAAADALEPAFNADRVHAWAGVRCTAPDRLPAVGPLDPDHLPGLMVCTAMGSRGLTLAVLCGELLAARLHGEPLPIPLKQARALSPQRWASPQKAIEKS